jgi:hypothetical protein
MTSGSQREFAALLVRHEAFWSRDDVEVPLKGTSRWPYITTDDFAWDLPSPAGFLEPEMLEVGHFLPQYEARFEERGHLDGDFFWSAMPLRSVPWFEAIVGCQAYYSLPGGAMSGEVRLSSLDDFDPIATLEANPWFHKLIEFTEGLVDLSHGRFPVSPPIARGPWDIVSATRGATDTLLDMYDRPEALAHMAEACADVWIAVTRRLASIVPPWHGGYVSQAGVWAPTYSVLPQSDASVSVSSEMYRELMAPVDRRVAQAWTAAIFHLHSAGLQVVDEVLGLMEGRALNVVLDGSGPALAELLPILQHVQAAGAPLHVMAFSRADADGVVGGLEARGLAVMYVPTP